MMVSPHRSRRLRGLLAGSLIAGGLAAVLPATALAGPGTGFRTDVSLEKTADRATYAPGETITYTFVVTNVGFAAVDPIRIRISDPLVGNIQPTTPIVPGGRVLPTGGSVTFTGTRIAGVGDCGVLTNTATTTLVVEKVEDIPDQSPADNTSSTSVNVQGEACAPPPVTPPPVAPPPPVTPPTVTPPVPPPGGTTNTPVCLKPDLNAAITGPKRVVGGRAVTFRVRIGNTGAHPSTRTRVRVRIPAGFTLAQPRRGVTVRGRTVTIAVGTIRADRARVISLRLRPYARTSGLRALRADVTARCGITAAATVRVRALATQPRVQPAVTG